jgi:IS1 family transposase
MNRLSDEKQEAAIGALVEGNSIRSTERMFGIHRDTIMRLAVRVGDACAKLLDEKMRKLSCKQLQLDELWCYVRKKQRHVRPEEDLRQVGDFWTFVAVDPDTKLVPSHLVGKRDQATTDAFVVDIASRVENRLQISSDSLSHYVQAIEKGFAGFVDYGQVVKVFEVEPAGPGRYSPPRVSATKRTTIVGDPQLRSISTSHVERNNLTIRMAMRRFTRLTNAFSKKVENLRAAVALHFAHYNFVRIHRALRITPAMKAGVERRLWSIRDLIELAN